MSTLNVLHSLHRTTRLGNGEIDHISKVGPAQARAVREGLRSIEPSEGHTLANSTTRGKPLVMRPDMAPVVHGVRQRCDAPPV